MTWSWWTVLEAFCGYACWDAVKWCWRRRQAKADAPWQRIAPESREK